MRCFAFTCFLAAAALYSGSGFSQVVGQREMNAARQRQFLQQEAWRNSKAIALDQDNLPSVPKSQSECIDVRELANDSVGYLEYWQFKVFQVISPNEMLIAIDNPSIPFLWVSEYPTDDFVDDDPVRVIGLIEVTGTKEYTTVAGDVKKVRTIRLVSAERVKAMAEEHQRLEEEKLYRTWTSSDGKFSTKAMFIDFKDGKVRLKKPDGSEIEVSPQQLTREDQKFYKDLLRERRKSED